MEECRGGGGGGGPYRDMTLRIAADAQSRQFRMIYMHKCISVRGREKRKIQICM